MKPQILGVVLVSLGLAACTGKGTPLPGQAIDNSYVVDGIRWDSGTTIYVLARTFDANGKVGVCGAWSARGGSSIVSQFHQDVMAAGRVVLDGTTVVLGLTFMQEHGESTELRGAAANCVRSDVDWQPGFAEQKPDVDFPRMRFNI